jgi:putative ABC transport system substrate-binding protein
MPCRFIVSAIVSACDDLDRIASISTSTTTGGLESFGRRHRLGGAGVRAGLRDLGWVEGKNIVIEFRWADGVQQLPEFAAELVRMKVDVIYAPSSTMVEPARQATKTIPIVFSNHADPIGTGHVASLARPGGNITGLSELTTELNVKALETFREAVPQARRIGVLWNPTTPSQVPGLQSVKAAGESA